MVDSEQARSGQAVLFSERQSGRFGRKSLLVFMFDQSKNRLDDVAANLNSQAPRPCIGS
jgi:hypothetical protein